MHHTTTSRDRRACQRGSNATPVLVFLGIVVLSVIFFFALTLPRQLEKRKAAQQKAAAEHVAREKEEAAAQAKHAAEELAAREAEEKKAAEAAAAASLPGRFTSPRAFMQTLADKLAGGDMAPVRKLLGEAISEEQAKFLATTVTEAGLKPASSPLVEIGDLGQAYRWGIRLSEGGAASATPQGEPRPENPTLPPADVGTTPDAQPAPADTVTLEVDVTRDATLGWRAAAVHFPAALRERVAAKLGAGAVPASVASAEMEATDPLKIGSRFLDAVLKLDYAAARAITDEEKVTREKVAGLCILFEEGSYHVAEQRPLTATAVGPDSSWVIVKVQSAVDQTESDFGVELQKQPSGAWRVTGLNFSKLLAAYMQSAGATEGAAYTPIVKSPGGGESLVVYFDFNEAGLVPRAQRQLEIVANLLRDDAKRRITLTGHADAIGSDTYNQRLSAARALAVKDALSALGVAPGQIVTKGFGNLQPLDPNTKPDGTDNPEGRSRNRRTEIFLDF